MIEKVDAKNLSDFMRKKIETIAHIKTDKWTGYTPLKKDFENLAQLDFGEKDGNFIQMHRTIMMFKAWLRGFYRATARKIGNGQKV